MPGSSEDNSYNSDGNGTLSGIASLHGKGDPSSAAVPDTASDTSDQSPLSALSSRLTESESAARNHRRINITWWQAAIAFIVAILIVGTGGAIVVKNEIHYQEQMHAQRELELYQEMKQIVHSEECRKIIEAGLKWLDPQALSGQGVINSYEIDDTSIKSNPMGGISFDTIINKDKKLDVSFTIDKDTSSSADPSAGRLEESSSSVSGELSALLKAKYGNDYLSK